LSTPLLLTKLIGPDPQGAPFDYPWHYRSIIGKLNFFEKSTRADISYPVHQCTCFMESPKQSHGIAIKRIGRYLLDTRDKGLIIKPDKLHSFIAFVDADFCGNWDKFIAAQDPNTAKSRTGFLIKYMNAPIFWQSKMQTQFALSSAESKYIALSTAAQFVKSIMYLLEEICQQGIHVTTVPTVCCHMFEDNSAALQQHWKLQESPKFALTLVTSILYFIIFEMKLPTSAYYSPKLLVKTMKPTYSPSQLDLISSSSIAWPFLAGNYYIFIKLHHCHHAS
jgi:hypothetical protein